MTAPSLANAVEFQFEYSLAGQYLQHSIFLLNEGPFSIVSITEMADDLVEWWDTLMAPVFSADLTLQSVVGWSIDPFLPITANNSTGTPTSGQVGSGSAPISVACRTDFISSFIGRNKRGRNYQSGLPKASVDNITIDPLVVSDIQAAWQSLGTMLLLGSWSHVNIARTEDGAPLVPQLPVTVIGYLTRNLVKDMGRRLDN